MTPDERIRLQRFEHWLNENQEDLQTFYGHGLGQPLQEIGLYAMPDGIHAQLKLANGLSFDFLLSGIEPETASHEFTYGKET